MSESPIGSIIAFGGPHSGSWETQSGWLHCDGRLLDRFQPDFRDLFGVIGFAWGGDGNTKFNLPDLQGFFLRGVDASRQPALPDAQVPFPVDPDRDERIPSRPWRERGARGWFCSAVCDSASAA